MVKLMFICKGDGYKERNEVAYSSLNKNISNLKIKEYESKEDYTGKISINDLNDDTELEWLYFGGHHGNFRELKKKDKFDHKYELSNNFFPTALNGRNFTVISELIKGFKKKKISAKLIILDCCHSAGYIPLLKEILSDKGIIIAAYQNVNTLLINFYNSSIKKTLEKRYGVEEEDIGNFSYVIYSKKQNSLFRTENNMKKNFSFDKDVKKTVKEVELFLKKNISGLNIKIEKSRDDVIKIVN